jgi:hypothetical protein
MSRKEIKGVRVRFWVWGLVRNFSWGSKFFLGALGYNFILEKLRSDESRREGKV